MYTNWYAKEKYIYYLSHLLHNVMCAYTLTKGAFYSVCNGFVPQWFPNKSEDIIRELYFDQVVKEDRIVQDNDIATSNEY